MQAEHLDAAPGDRRGRRRRRGPRRAREAWRRSRVEIARRAPRRRAYSSAASRSQIRTSAARYGSSLVESSSGTGPDELGGHAPRGAERAHVAAQEVARERPGALERVDDRLRAGVRVAVHVAADPGAEPQRGRRARDRVVAARARAAAAPATGWPRRTRARCGSRRRRAAAATAPRPSARGSSPPPRSAPGRAAASSAAAPGRRAGAAPSPAAGAPGGSSGGVASVGCAVSTGPDLEPRGRRAQLVVADPGLAQARDRIGERLARHPALVLVLPPASQPVVLLGDVRELEEERERPQHRGLPLEVEAADRLLELRAIARLTRVAGEAADPLLQLEQLLALLLDEHAARARRRAGGRWHEAARLENSQSRYFTFASEASFRANCRPDRRDLACLGRQLERDGLSAGRHARAARRRTGTAAVAAPRFVRTIATGETGWFASPGLVDLNGDGRLEIVAPFYSTFVFDAKGRPLGKGTATKGRVYAPGVVADLDGDKVAGDRRRRQRGNGRGVRAPRRAPAARARLARLDVQRRPVSRGAGHGGRRSRRGRPHRGRRDDDEHLADRIAGVRLRRAGLASTGRRALRRRRGRGTTRCAGKGNDADFNGDGNHGYGAYGENVGIGNLDDDPQLEIVVTFDNHQINVFNHDGTSVLASPWFRNRDSRHAGAGSAGASSSAGSSPVVEDRHYHQHVGPWPHPKTDDVAAVDGLAAVDRRPRPRRPERGDRAAERGDEGAVRDAGLRVHGARRRAGAAARGRRAGTQGS